MTYLGAPGDAEGRGRGREQGRAAARLDAASLEADSGAKPQSRPRKAKDQPRGHGRREAARRRDGQGRGRPQGARRRSDRPTRRSRRPTRRRAPAGGRRWRSGSPSRDNPLTARVAVNHIWGWHFGRPLVETTINFGRSGKPPTHPELLDWLAVELMDNGWKMKPLHRLIVTSRAYRMSSKAADVAEPEADPDNIVPLAVPDAAGWKPRWSATACCTSPGELDATTGGPEIPQDQGLTSRRRSLYFAHHGETPDGVPRPVRRRQPVRRLPPHGVGPAAAGAGADATATWRRGSAACWRGSCRAAGRTTDVRAGGVRAGARPPAARRRGDGARWRSWRGRRSCSRRTRPS